MDKNDFAPVLFLIFLALILALPFANKAVTIDDPLYISVARQITKDPFHPFSFDAKWSTSNSSYTVTGNPPLVSYYYALIMRLFGESEKKLHIAYLIFPIISAISMHFLSKKFTKRPMIASLLLIGSTGFFVNSTNLMYDVPFLSFSLLSLALCIYGIDGSKPIFAALGCFFLGLAYLSKYSAIIMFPILILYSLYSKKYKFIFYLSIPLIIILSWNLFTYSADGTPHQLETWKWVHNSRKFFGPEMNIARLITNFTYIGGALIFPLMLIYPFVKRKGNAILWAFSGLISIALSISIYYSSVFKYRYTIPQLILLSFFFSTGMSFFLLVIRHYSYLFSRPLARILAAKDGKNFFVFSWIILGFIYGIFLAGGSVRHIILIFPPLIITYVNMLEKYIPGKMYNKFAAACIVSTIIMAIAVAAADYWYTDSYRNIPKAVKQYKTADNVIWFSGFDGFQYYMLKEGYQILETDQSLVKKGDIIVKAQIPSPRQISASLLKSSVLLETIAPQNKLPIRTYNPKAHAGFYAFGNGFLPYSFSNASLEEFEVYKIV